MKDGLPVVVFTIFLLGGGVPTSMGQRPNLVLMVSDNQPWWAMGCADNRVISTPHLDQLAQEGVRFRNAFVTTPVCAASRASLFTGLYRRKHGFTFRTPPFAARLAAASYPAQLRGVGYRTALIGKFGLETNGRLQVEEEKVSLGRMFDHFDQFEHWGHPGPRGYFVKKKDGTKRHLTEVTGDKAVAFLKSCRPEEPFCLTLCFNAPHAQDDDPQQYFWPVSVDHLYRDAVIPAPRNSEPAFFAAQPDFIRNSLGRERWRWRFNTPSKYQAMMKGMYRMVSGVDQVVGRIRSALRDAGLDRNTVLVFTSDNGMFFGERGLSDCWLLYEESLRVPLLVLDPRGGAGGIVREEMVLNIDLAPTFLTLAGIEIQKSLPVDGRSMIPLLREKNGEGWRKDFLCEHLFEHAKIPRSEGVRTRRWKYIRYIDQVPVREELYDLHTDPSERVNLAGEDQHAVRLKELRERCASLIRGDR